MRVTIFGASGPTGLELCRQALAVGHRVIARMRHPDTFPLHADTLTVLHADVLDGPSLAPVVDDADAVLSTLGAAYARREIHVYSVGTKAIVTAMRASEHTRRLVVVSAGLTPQNPPTMSSVRQLIRSHPLCLTMLRLRPVRRCVPCKDAAPVLEAGWERYRAQGVAFIGVDFKDTEQDATAFLRRHGVTYPSGRDLKGDAAVLYGTTGIPETFFIDRRGVIVCKFSSAISAAFLDERIQAILR
jgi:peroxiredoxin